MSTTHFSQNAERPGSFYGWAESVSGHPPAETVSIVRLSASKWLVRRITEQDGVDVLGFIHLHRGRYELLRVGARPTRVFVLSEQAALEYFTHDGGAVPSARVA